ncbi:MAG: hypothetical protein LBS33_02355, partial [Streptococcaceae bacterium]|nr:hypothetical protein [Streptococcaceae bacterium]
KLKRLLFFSSLFCLLPLTAHGDSDGRLQLNSDIITNRSGGGTSVSDFEIRSQLFSNALDEKMQEKARQEAEATIFSTFRINGPHTICLWFCHFSDVHI